MTPIPTITPEFSPEFVSLCARRRDLGELAADPATNSRELAAMYEQLAADFDDAGYPSTAYTLRKKAARLEARR